MKLHIWTDRVSYLAVAHAESVSEARELLLKESDLGESGDGSCPERDKARRAILSETSAVYVGRVAEFSLSDNAQLREQENHSEKLHQQIAAKDRRIAELEAQVAGHPEALAAAKREAIDRCIAIARGCEDYGGGYCDRRELDVYHHGMQTVQRCLIQLREGDDSYQLNRGGPGPGGRWPDLDRRYHGRRDLHAQPVQRSPAPGASEPAGGAGAD